MGGSAPPTNPAQQEGRAGRAVKCTRRLGHRPGTAPTPGGGAGLGAAGAEAGLPQSPRPARTGAEKPRTSFTRCRRAPRPRAEARWPRTDQVSPRHWSPVHRRAAAAAPTAGAVDVRLTSDVTPRRGGAERRRRAFPERALGVGR